VIVEEQDVLALDGALDAGDEYDAALGGVVAHVGQVQLPVVQRHRQRVVLQRRCPVDELNGRIGNPVERIVGGVTVEFDLQHIRLDLQRACHAFAGIDTNS